MRLGVDVGGSKVEVALLDRQGRVALRQRAATPQGSYEEALHALSATILAVERDAGEPCTVGVGIPGALSPRSGLVQNAYNTPLNGRPLKSDLEAALARGVRLANDANCFALSEALDGAARGARVVFGAILGTGAGGGIAVDRRILEGRNAIGGEWGHNPLPWMTREEHPGPACYCGRSGCIEQFVSGPALARDKTAVGEAAALARYQDRLARALAHVVNLLDPDVIVIGGGVSNLEHLYAEVPPLLARYVYTHSFDTPLLRAAHGDASGVRGAAMLWDQT
ncbi:MAG: ROK family protein [Betaproteobacteria bacterium]|nr:MAG: ROK family protein [Betaproteobacteria bacterium]